MIFFLNILHNFISTMCSVLATSADLMSACFDKDSKRFLKLLKALKTQSNVNRALVWCVQADWEAMVHFLVNMENAELHNPPYNLLCEAVRYSHKYMVKWLIRIGNFSDSKYLPEVIEAVQLAEEKCNHEIAFYLLDYILSFTTEGVLAEKYNFKISDNLRVYMHTKDYLRHTRCIRQINYVRNPCS